jgi:hypothetical protein
VPIVAAQERPERAQLDVPSFPTAIRKMSEASARFGQESIGRNSAVNGRLPSWKTYPTLSVTEFQRRGRANLVTSLSKLSATAVIVSGGALVGVIAGWDLAPMTLQLGAAQLATLCAVIGALFTLTGCCYASEAAEARAETHRQLARIARLNLLIAKDVREDRMARKERATSGS